MKIKILIEQKECVFTDVIKKKKKKILLASKL